MTNYDLAMMECALAHRPVTVIVFKAGFIVVVAS